MNKLMVCGFAVLTLAANAVEIVDLTAAARKAGSGNYAIIASSSATRASSARQDRPASAAFDGVYTDNSAKAWWTNPDDVGGTSDQWISYQFTESFAPGKYIHLTDYTICANASWMGNSAKTCKGPKDWTFEGSRDGVSWEILDRRSGYTASAWSGLITFPLAVNACYRYYRLHMTAIVGSSAGYYVIPDIRLNGEILNSEEEGAKTRYWVGGATGDWNNAANWTQSGDSPTVPQAGERVFLGSAEDVSVTLSQSMPRLADFRLGGYSAEARLTTTNWMTAVNADNVEIGNKGVLTCAKSSTVDGETNRVYVICRDFTVAKGGSVSADGRGYVAKNGPGTYDSDSRAGASHGGFGGVAITSASALYTKLPYGDETAPVELGSGGTSTKWGTGAPGGGAIRIVATGNVTVDGVVSANGGNTPAHDKLASSNGRTTAGSGGSVYVTCRTFSGTNGTVRANGGGGQMILTGSGAYDSEGVEAAAGGGRIAIAAECPVAGRISGMTFSAAGGEYRGGAYTAASQFYSKVTTVDRFMTEPDLGTLWFSDAGFLESLGKGITGQVVGLESLTVNELMFASGHVRFASGGFSLTVTGDLTVSNDTARLELGGDTAEILFQRASLRTSERVSLSVGGSLRVVQGGRIDVRAAATNDVEVWGATVSVAGDLTVGDAASIRVWSDPVNGGSPVFSVSNVIVAAGGRLTADGGGFLGGWAYQNVVVVRSGGLGPGGPNVSTVGSAYSAAGASHGGKGGFPDSKGLPETYDDEWNPSQAGSGGCCRWKYQRYGGVGGGVVRVSALDLIRIDGTVSADGTSAWSAEGGGSGGTVFLRGHRLEGADTGRISANGGSGSNANGGTGGGGRIAIWLGLTGTDRIHCTKGLTNAVFASEQYAYLGSLDALAGTNALLEEGSEGLGKDGTVRYVRCDSKPGLMLFVR